jgi:hypothetical protein
MKLLFLLILTVAGMAQTTRTVTLSWTDTVNPVGTTYSVYRASGPCSGTPTFTKINVSPITAKTYQDTGLTPGQYCYAATATFNAEESVQSAAAGARVTPFAPSGVSVTVQ